MSTQQGYVLTALQPRKRAIAYYRHSAEDKQENSVPIQRELTRKFADENSITIIHEEADEGKTGLRADRPGFQRLLQHWIMNKSPRPFDYVLVLDVSRWGRFQNLNEPAHYQWLCEERGKEVIYISHGFPKKENEDLTQIQLSFERIMAARYSKQLSDKVFHGCMFVSKQGFSAGGPPCYGMDRILLDESRTPIRVLRRGEHKQISNQRVTFAPAHDASSEVVCTIFRSFLSGTHPAIIAQELNTKNIPTPSGGVWRTAGIFRILRNETYAGTRVYNKTSNRLRKGRCKNPRAHWIICQNAFPGLIDKEKFFVAQQNLDAMVRKHHATTKISKNVFLQVLSDVRNFLDDQGFDHDAIHTIHQWFPLTMAIPCRRNMWCFLLPKHWKKNDQFVGISVLPDDPQHIDRCFALHLKDFGIGGVCFFGEGDDQYKRCILSDDSFIQTIMSVAQKCTHAPNVPIPCTTHAYSTSH